MHTRVSGVADHYAHDDDEALHQVRAILESLNPGAARTIDIAEAEDPKYDPEELLGLVPLDVRTPYDVREVIARIVDGSRFQEFKALLRHDARHRLRAHPRHARRASWPTTACCSRPSAQKGAHFVELCGQRGIPLAVPAERDGLHGRQATPRAAASHATAPRWCRPWPP